MLNNLVEFNYPGAVFGVHPRLSELFGRACYPSLSDIPQPPDCVALAVANHHLLALLEEAARLQIPSAIVFGDPTVGAGRNPELQDQIADVARQSEMAVCGPNAMGVYALHLRLVISGYPVRTDLPAGNVALITHSGTVFDAMSQNNRDVCFNYVISCGNEAVLSTADYLHHVLDDPATEVVALYLETVRNPSGFLSGLQRAANKHIPVIALKVGLSERGKAMAQTHTGALAGGAETYSALFKRYGVRQVHSLDEMMDTVELFSQVQETPGSRMSVLMESGGERSLVADLCDGLDLEFAQLSRETNARLSEALEPGVVPENPLDAFGTGHDVVGVYSQCLKAMDADPDTGLLVLAVDLARDSYLSPAYVEAALKVREQLTKPLTGMVNLTAGANPELMARLRANGIPVLMGTDTSLKAIHHLIAFSAGRSRSTEPPALIGRPSDEVLHRLREQIERANAPLDEHESKCLLSSYGIPVTEEKIAEEANAAVKAARSLGFPVALKTAAPDVLHKSEIGGILLNLNDDDAVREAYAVLDSRCGPRVLVQEMAPPGTEMILGMKSDPQFGPVLLVGLGGIFVEVYKDIATALPPLSRGEAESLPGELRGNVILKGTRGRPAANGAALTDTLLRFSTLVSDLGDLLSEVDVNPLLVSPSGAKVLDALVIPK